MIHLPPPRISNIEGFTVVDDSETGTKTRIAMGFARQSLCDHFYYATTPHGASPVALAEACSVFGRKLTLLSTQLDNDKLTPALQKACDFGAELHVFPTKDYNIVSELSEKMAEDNHGELIDFDSEHAIKIIGDVAKSLNLAPAEIWSAAAKGAMARGYQLAWPDARHHVVAVLKYSKANYGSASAIFTNSAYHEPARTPAPFPCNPCYEGKAWEIMKKILGSLRKKYSSGTPPSTNLNKKSIDF